MVSNRDWNALRLIILHRDLGVCQYCGDPAVAVDHVIPRSRGGSDDLDNLKSSCTRCNSLGSNNLFANFEDRKAYILSWKDGRPDPSYLVDGDGRTPHQPMLELLNAFNLQSTTKDLTSLGKTLARAIGQKKPFTFKHLNAVTYGHFEPGKNLRRAIEIVLAQLDGASPLIGAYSVEVLSMNPDVAGALIPPLDPKICDRDDCILKFIPNVSWRKRCYLCSPIRSR